MKNRDYRLVVDGKFNMKAIMQRAWVYVRNYGFSFNSSLHISWADARVALNDYHRELRFNEAVENGTLFPKKNLSLSDLYSNQFGDMANGNVCK